MSSLSHGPLAALVRAIDAVLPQTQCARCGYPDCLSYAQAIAQGQPINQCPPGGAEGVARLSAITGQPTLPLNPDNGAESARALAVIDENWCIGCTLCIKACPVDAIVGANKTMHTVLEPECTGCELCVPVCPVDCIAMVPISGQATGWAAWSAPQAARARQRYQQRLLRLQPPTERAAPAPAPAATASPTPAAGPTAKSALLAAVLQKAHNRRSSPTQGKDEPSEF